ncbi:hypothetical protein J2Z70_004567 [Paenibacillus silagei]|uniref:EpsG family protein n=1 Tax=Paenibacillus silagei TaxID=1670801 RepID=A0ABS4NWH3_9BACL|nr:hypothetical protein [Paenibacillus silagei]
MLNYLMHGLNSFAIAWIGFVFLSLFFFRLKIERNVLRLTIYITVFSLSVFAYNYEPTVFTDLYRYYEILNIMRYTGSSFYNSQELINVFLFNLVAKTPYNQLLPFTVTLIRYGLLFGLIYKFIKLYNIENYLFRFFIVFYFAFIPLIESISGVRYYLSITIFGVILINEFYFNRKSLYKILYVFPLLIHTSSVMFLALRLLVIDKVYRIIRPFRFIIIFWTFFSFEISFFLQKINTSFTLSAARMLTFYTEEDRTISLRLTIARFIMISVIYAMFCIIKKKDKIIYSNNFKNYVFLELVLLFSFGSVFHDVFFQRNIFFIVLICMPMFYDFFKSEFIEYRLKRIFKVIILVLSIGMYLNQIYGIISGYF